jgi:hypothetical protein
VKPNIIRNSRWRCDKGFDVDLDDGSSNYEIYNNVFLHGGLKLREGYNRHATNNIGINSSLHPHVWFPDSGDVVTGNIWGGPYKAAMDLKKKWPQKVDNNFFSTEKDRAVGLGAGWDANSLVGDPQFVDQAKGNYAVKEGSPALKIGFKNFPMDQFGVQKPELKAIARTPELPIQGVLPKNEKSTEPSPKTSKMTWLGAVVRDVTDGEYSVYGVTQESGGVVLQRISRESPLATAHLRNNDLIQGVNGTPIRNLKDLEHVTLSAPLKIEYVRDQGTKTATVTDLESVKK